MKFLRGVEALGVCWMERGKGVFFVLYSFVEHKRSETYLSHVCSILSLPGFINTTTTNTSRSGCDGVTNKYVEKNADY